METLIHLKTSESFKKLNDVDQSKVVIDKFIESCMHLDASIFEPYMQEEDVFEDKEKYKFLDGLKRVFDKGRIEAEMDFRVISEDRICKGCNLGKMIKNFEVWNRQTNCYLGSFGFFILAENGILKDIYRCLLYKEAKKVWIKSEDLPGIFISKHIEPDW